MKLMAQAEADDLLDKVRQHRFAENRLNVPCWCGFWIWLVAAILGIAAGILIGFISGNWREPYCLLFFCAGLIWFTLSLLNHCQWQLYKTRYLFKMHLDKETSNQRIETEG